MDAAGDELLPLAQDLDGGVLFAAWQIVDAGFLLPPCIAVAAVYEKRLRRFPDALRRVSKNLLRQPLYSVRGKGTHNINIDGDDVMVTAAERADAGICMSLELQRLVGPLRPRLKYWTLPASRYWRNVVAGFD